jgi:Fur family peroxide stress response transcriptional regulator
MSSFQPIMSSEQFRDWCRAAGLSHTHQREVIYRTVMESRNHPSPEAIYERVRREIPAISLGTVYKNIRTFVEAGLLKEVSLHHGTLRVDANLEDHHHLVCARCRAIVDLEEDDIEPVRLKRKLPRGYRVLRTSVEIHGLCPVCAGQADPPDRSESN